LRRDAKFASALGHALAEAKARGHQTTFG